MAGRPCSGRKLQRSDTHTHTQTHAHTHTQTRTNAYKHHHSTHRNLTPHNTPHNTQYNATQHNTTHSPVTDSKEVQVGAGGAELEAFAVTSRRDDRGEQDDNGEGKAKRRCHDKGGWIECECVSVRVFAAIRSKLSSARNDRDTVRARKLKKIQSERDKNLRKHTELLAQY